LNELVDIRREACNNTRFSKERAKVFHGRHINRKELSLGKNAFSMIIGFTYLLGNIGLGGSVPLKLSKYFTLALLRSRTLPKTTQLK